MSSVKCRKDIDSKFVNETFKVTQNVITKVQNHLVGSSVNTELCLHLHKKPKHLHDKYSCTVMLDYI